MKTIRYELHTKYLGIALVSALVALLTHPILAKDNPSDHPIRVIKARYQNDNSRGGATSARGNLTVWLKNVAEVTVDGVEIEVDLYNDRGRKVETLRKEVKDLGPGEKRVTTFRWDVVAENEVKPRFYIEYKSRGTQKTRFEGDPPSWN
jgi:hypothetical protein